MHIVEVKAIAMKTIRSPNAESASSPDWVVRLVEIVWQSGLAIFQISLGCVLGVIVFSQLGTVAWLIGSFTSLPTKQIPTYMPAAGWFVGFLIGLFQSVPSLKKWFNPPPAEQSSEQDDDDATDQEPDPGSATPEALSGPVSLKAKSIRTLREGGIGVLLGLIMGLFMSLYLIIVCTAGILSPFAPASWRDGFRMRTMDQQRDGSPSRRSRRSDHDEGVGTGAEFWHPVYGSILKWTLPTSAIAGCVFCIVAKEEKIA